MLATANPIMKEVYRQAVLTGLDVQDTLQSPNDGYATRFNGTALNAVCEYYGYTRQTEECFQFVFWELSFQVSNRGYTCHGRAWHRGTWRVVRSDVANMPSVLGTGFQSPELVDMHGPGRGFPARVHDQRHFKPHQLDLHV
jgi:hypothetical protein